MRRPSLPGDTDRWLGFIVLAFVLILPLFIGFRGGFQNTLLFIGIYMVLALGLNIVVGFTGLLDLGYVIFLAIGAILTRFLLLLTFTEDGIDWRIGKTEPVLGTPVLGFDGSILLIIVAAGLLCALIGLLRGIPTLRVTGDYYAIVTLGFAEIMYETFLWDENNPFSGNPLNLSRISGGAFGISLDNAHRPTLFGTKLYYDSAPFYYLVVACVLAAILIARNVNRSRVGRALAAIRLDETAARSCGVNVSRYKLVAFAISGFLGGVGGALYAIWSGTVAVKSLDVWQSVLVLCCIVLGGMGSVRGVVVGTAILMSLGEVLRDFAEARFLVYGIVLIALMRFRPQGLLPPRRRGEPLTAEERAERFEGECSLYSLLREEKP